MRSPIEIAPSILSTDYARLAEQIATAIDAGASEHQDQAYRDQVLPPQVRARVTVEESSTYGWHRYAGTGGAILGMETFGASAPIQQIQAKFGFEPGHVIEAAKDQLARWRRE
jgi:transketolase